jgi:hypothetical protein
MRLEVLGPLRIDGEVDGSLPRDRVVLEALVTRRNAARRVPLVLAGHEPEMGNRRVPVQPRR